MGWPRARALTVSYLPELNGSGSTVNPIPTGGASKNDKAIH